MRFSFVIKCAIAAMLVVLFDRLFLYSFAGARIGAFAGRLTVLMGGLIQYMPILQFFTLIIDIFIETLAKIPLTH